MDVPASENQQSVPLPESKQKRRWRGLTLNQKLTLLVFLLIAISLPLSVIAAVTRTRVAPRAYQVVTPPNPTPTPQPMNPISWITPSVSLDASDFYLTTSSGSGKYQDNTGSEIIHSDPGNRYYTTLEATWQERGVEMRLYLYFAADSENWWVSQIRTYDGRNPANWIYYTGPFFSTRFGNQFNGDIDLLSDNRSGTIHLRNLALLPFKPFLPTPTPSANANPVITTTSLPVGVIYRRYLAAVAGFDSDAGDTGTMIMSASGLPTGLTLDRSSCRNVRQNGRLAITCSITGVPRQTGTFPVTITLQDNRGGRSEKIMALRIVRSPAEE